MSLRRALVAGALWLLLILVFLAFRPGLTGPFIFDSVRNLQPLGVDGGIHSLAALGRFVFTGQAGPLGRPISLLTFAFNGIDWPTDPWAFKYTNVLIHLLNGLLVFCLARRLVRTQDETGLRAEWIALGASAIWMLEPLQLTAVLFVVQRMTELSALFVLVALLVYLRGRDKLPDAPRTGYTLMSLAVGLGLPLAVLSKETGALLPLFIVVMEATLLVRDQHAPAKPHWLWRGMFLWLPLAAIVGYLALGLVHSGGHWSLRSFTAAQRELTEPRVLLDYARLIFFPNLYGMGLFHDDYVASTGWLSPWTTLPSILALGGALSSALVVRRRYPLPAFAVLWFLAGHALTAGPVGIELYFEHRSYLALFGPALAIAWLLLRLPLGIRRVGYVGLLVFIVLLGSATWRESRLWGDFRLLAMVSARENPTSIRAQQAGARYWSEHGRPQAAMAYLDRAAHDHPHNIGLELQRMMLDCRDGKLNQVRYAAVLRDARSSVYANEAIEALKRLGNTAAQHKCTGLTRRRVLRINSELLHNPNFGTRKIRRNLYFERAHMYADERVIDKTLASADKAYASWPSYQVALQSAAWALSAGMPDRAMRYVVEARDTPSHSIYGRWSRDPHKIAELTSAIRFAQQLNLPGQKPSAGPGDHQTATGQAASATN